MKKFVMIAFVAAATLFTACNTKTEGAGKDNKDSVQVEATTPEATENKAEGDLVDRYSALVDKLIVLQEKAKKGDTAAVQESAKLQEEAMALATEFQQQAGTMTAEQQAKFAEIAKRLTDAAMKQ